MPLKHRSLSFTPSPLHLPKYTKAQMVSGKNQGKQIQERLSCRSTRIKIWPHVGFAAPKHAGSCLQVALDVLVCLHARGRLHRESGLQGPSAAKLRVRCTGMTSMNNTPLRHKLPS